MKSKYEAHGLHPSAEVIVCWDTFQACCLALAVCLEAESVGGDAAVWHNGSLRDASVVVRVSGVR